MRPNIAGSVNGARREPPAGVRIALIANAASGGGLDPEPLVATMRRHGAEVRARGCGPEGLAVVAAWGPDRIAVAGGDGTIGDCAELAGRLGVPLAVIPLGTANDFARTAELPLEVEAACVLAVTGSALRPLELGRLPRRGPARRRARGGRGAGGRFVRVAAPGRAAAAARRAAPFKRLGPLAYPVGAV